MTVFAQEVAKGSTTIHGPYDSWAEATDAVSATWPYADQAEFQRRGFISRVDGEFAVIDDGRFDA